ncbi:MAG: hypothetical protein ACTHKK_10935 [Candidatus Nitrosocosmicus sp.]
MNLNNQSISKWLKSNYKGLMIVAIMAIASLIINAYFGFGPKQNQQQPSLTPPSSIIERNTQSNPKADPFAMRSSFNLKIIMDNKPFAIPSQIGIEEPLWNNHSLDKYGAPGMPMKDMIMPGMAPIYTNDKSGLIKIGSVVIRNYTLGDFFNIWGFNLNDKTVINATANGKPILDFKNHILKDKEKIYLNISNRSRV